MGVSARQYHKGLIGRCTRLEVAGSSDVGCIQECVGHRLGETCLSPLCGNTNRMVFHIRFWSTSEPVLPATQTARFDSKARDKLPFCWLGKIGQRLLRKRMGGLHQGQQRDAHRSQTRHRTQAVTHRMFPVLGQQGASGLGACAGSGLDHPIPIVPAGLSPLSSRERKKRGRARTLNANDDTSRIRCRNREHQDQASEQEPKRWYTHVTSMKVLRLNSETFPMASEERREYDRAGVEIECRELPSEYEDEALLRQADALGVVSAKIGRTIIGRLENCKVISRYGTGTDNIDVAFATSRRILVTNVPDFGLSEMADHTLALLLALARKLFIMDRCTRTGQWQARVKEPVQRIAGKTLGLVGFGRIGREVARRAVTFGLQILATDPQLDYAACARLGVVPVSLPELLESSDFVSLHLPLIPETLHLIGERELCRMKRSAFLINTARGAVVDEAALVKALQQGWIAGAGLDVYEGLSMFDLHPPVPDHPLFRMENVILTPHCGGCSGESLQELYQRGAQNALTVLQGLWPHHCVNPEVVPRISLVRAAGYTG